MPEYNLGTARGKIDIDASGAKRGAREARDSVDEFTGSLGDNERGADRANRSTKDLEGGLLQLAGGAGIAAASIQLLKFPAMVQGITLATGAVGALTAGAVALGASLAPLAGLLPAAAAGALALAQGAGVAKLALSNIEDGFTAALKAADEFGVNSRQVQEVLRDYSPPARQLITTLLSLKEPFEALRDAAQGQLFPGLIDAIRTLRPLMDSFRPIVLGTARVLGDLARAGADLIASPGFSGQLLQLGRANIGVIRGLGNAALTVAPALLTLVTAAQPVVDLFVRMANNAATAFSTFVEGAQNSGALAAFFRETQGVVQTLSSILRSLGGIFLNVGRAAYDTGQQLLGSFDGALRKLRELTGSVAGQTALRDFFESARPAIEAIGRLLGDVATGLAGSFRGLTPAIAPVIDQIRTQFLPALITLFSKIDGPFLSSLVNLATAWANFFNTFSTATPALTLLVNIVALLANAFVGVIDALGPLGTIIVNILSLLGAAGLVSGILNVMSVLGRFSGIAAGVRLVMIGLTAAFWAISAPVLAVIGVIGALIAVGIVVVKNWDTIKAAAFALWQFVQAAFRAGVEFVRGLIAQFVGFLGGAWNSITNTARNTWTIIRNVVVESVRGAVDSVRNAIGGIIGFLAGAWGRIVGAVRNAWNSFRDAVVSGANGAVNFVRGIPGRILGALGNLGGLLFGAGRSIIDGLIRGISSAFGRVQSMLSRLTNLLPSWKGPASRDRKILYDAGQLVIGGFTEGLESQFTNVRRTLADLGNSLPGTLPLNADLALSGARPSMALAGSAGILARPGAGASNTTTTTNYGGDTITVEATTNADPQEISRDIVWAKRIRGR